MLFVNYSQVINERFPNGELLLDKWLSKYTEEPVTLRFYYRTDADLIELYMVAKYLKERKCKPINLRIEYMPYSRMDRKKKDGDAFTLKYICDFINSLEFDRITIFEPHSDVCVALLNAEVDNFINYAYCYLKDRNILNKDDYLFFPDSSAQKRYSNILSNPYLVGFKHRDWTTGRITDYKVMNPNQNLDFQGADVALNNSVRVFIIDDLCAKGTTAWNAANELQKLGFDKENIYLVVAHCEDSIFEGKLLKDDSPIAKVITTDSILTMKHEKLVIINV